MGLTLWRVRHAPVLAPTGVCYGRSDWAADAHATEAAAQALAAALPHGVPVWHSPALRCVQLAQGVAALRADLALCADERLRELDFGAWEGRAWSAIERDDIDAWVADFAYHRPGGGESTAELLGRVQAALDDAQTQHTELVWVCHAGVIRALDWLGQAPNLPLCADAWPASTVPYGTWSLQRWQ